LSYGTQVRILLASIFVACEWFHHVTSKTKNLATTLAKEDHCYSSSGKGKQHEGSFKTQEFVA
jgi:hypothetical protein